MNMKRNLFEELSDGFQALKDERQGKVTLKQHPVKLLLAPQVTTDELVKLRERLHLSQAVFARYLRINKRTLENWEQGRAKPNAQAAVLIKMVEKYPDTIDRFFERSSKNRPIGRGYKQKKSLAFMLAMYTLLAYSFEVQVNTL